MQKLVLTVLVVGVCGAGFGEVIYSNDFSVRTSVQEPVPGPWLEYDYVLGGRLAYNFTAGSYNYTDEVPWSSLSEMQDGWVNGGSGGWSSGSYVLTNNAEECPGDTTHAFGSFQLSAMMHTWNRILQPIGNSFTNGVVRYTVDMRPPRWWGTAHNGGWNPLFRFYPAFRRDLRSPEIGNNAEENPCAVGFTQDTRTDSYENVLVEGAKLNMRYGSSSGIATGPEVVPGNWYRCHVTLDIDNATVLMSVDNMGGAVPSWNSTPVAVGVMQTPDLVAWRWPIDETRGPIDGIAFQVEGVNSYEVVTNMPCFTNIKVEWKAPGSGAFLSCYENDFTTRRMRVLQPRPTTFVYPAIASADVEVCNNAYCGTWAANSFPTMYGDRNLLTQTLVNGGNSLEPVGWDCWRRIFNCWAFATIADNGGNRVFRVTWPWGKGDASGVYGVFAQPLGETITTGKVRMVVDMRTPCSFWFPQNSGMYVALGDHAHYASYGNASESTCISVAGIGCGGATLAYPEMKTGGSWPNAKGTYTCETSHWYQVETVVDLNAKTFDYRLYDLEDTETDVPVYERTGMAFAVPGAAGDIAAFSIMAYGPGVEPGEEMLFDNVQVWKNWDEANGTGDEIYRNNFQYRWRPTVRYSENLGDSPNLTVPEKDHWTIRGGDCDRAKRVLGENGNPCASFFVNPCGNYAMQDFGKVVKNGRLLFTADMRPPAYWHGRSSREASIYLGGAEMAQGNFFNGNSVWEKAAVLFGFDGGGVYAASDDIGHVVAAYVYDGQEARRFGFTVDSSHWYRFRAKVDMGRQTYDVDVFDMGGTHPEQSTADGTKIGSLTGLAFTYVDTDELSTICLHGEGLRTDTPWVAEDSGAVFYDNLKVELFAGGSLFIIR